MKNPRLIIGLGNPGKEYELTRHNLGFLVVDRFAEDQKVSFTYSSLLNSFQAQGDIDGQPYVLLKPLTYMNNSGVAVKKGVAQHKVGLPDLLVVADDLNLGFGQVRIRRQGSEGGHNGLRSIVGQLGTKEFARLRLGIGTPASKAHTVDYVLDEFDNDERTKLEPFIDEAVDCLTVWLKDGIAKAMTQFNKRKDE